MSDAKNCQAWIAKAAQQPMVLETVDLGPIGAEGHRGGFATLLRSHWVWVIPLPEKLQPKIADAGRDELIFEVKMD